MTISPSGTFDYVAIVPDSGADQAPWKVRLRTPIELTGYDQRDATRLVGHSPTLEISDAGMTPNVQTSPLTGTVSPRVLRSRLTLTAATRNYAGVASVSFHVDRALMMALCPHDMLCMARTGCGELALSIMRNGQLVAAVGAVSAVPLGEFVHARTPADILREAEALFRKHDPDFEFGHLPVEIRIGEQTRLLYGGRRRMDSYNVFVEHGFYRGEPGTNECVAISLIGTCPDVVAIASAQLLDAPGALEMIKWGA
jgi:hypothetical protein